MNRIRLKPWFKSRSFHSKLAVTEAEAEHLILTAGKRLINHFLILEKAPDRVPFDFAL
jgi:hypothetical protein